MTVSTSVRMFSHQPRLAETSGHPTDIDFGLSNVPIMALEAIKLL